MAEFVFTDEQAQLRSAVRRFCADNFDEQTVRRLMESEPPFDRAVFRFAQLAHDADADAAPVLFSWPSRAACPTQRSPRSATSHP